MDGNTPGTLSRQGNFLRVNNAVVEEVFFQNRADGYLVISYSVPRPNQIVSIETVRLNVTPGTVIVNFLGQPMCLCNIQRGMRVNAVFSSRMTRSIPPQANAFFIMVQRQTPAPPPANVTTDRVVRVDAANRFLYTGNPFDSNRQTRFVVTNHTSILDCNGNPIRLQALRPGQLVRVTHANFETAGIPPQTTAFTIQVL